MIVVSSGTTPRSALAALREGAFDFLEKSADPEVVLQILSRALEYHAVSRSDLTRMRQLERLKASALEIANLIRWDPLGQFLKDHGQYFCELCGDTAGTRYPPSVNARIYEVHHRKPLALADKPIRTTLDDLALLCANCHRSVHASSEVDRNYAALMKHFGK